MLKRKKDGDNVGMQRATSETHDTDLIDALAQAIKMVCDSGQCDHVKEAAMQVLKGVGIVHEIK